APGRDEGRLAAHGQADVPLRQQVVDRLADGGDPGPLPVVDRFGDAGVLGQAGDGVGEVEVDADGAGGAADRGGGGGVRGAREGDVPLAAEQPGGGVEADPAGAGDVD